VAYLISIDSKHVNLVSEIIFDALKLWEKSLQKLSYLMVSTSVLFEDLTKKEFSILPETPTQIF